MIFIKDHKEQTLFDPWDFLGPKRRNLLYDSWAGSFRDYILPALPVEKIAPYFNTDLGRPTKELYTIPGVMILQQTHDLTDEETISRPAFNMQWHYALSIPEESDAIRYICLKTLFNMRKIIMENRLDSVLFEETTGVPAKVFDADFSKQRTDSVHIRSDMKRLGRIGIFNQTICRFLINLKRQHRDNSDVLPEEPAEKYLPENNKKGCFSRVKPSESEKTLKTVSSDLHNLIERFKDIEAVCSMHSYKLPERVLEEQCIVKESGDENCETVSMKPPKEISSSSLQNPSDPDAAYSGHKGQGYQVQIMETFCDDEDDNILEIITYAEAEPACRSDAKALIPAMESVKERELLPEKIIADTLYGSDENVAEAEKRGVRPAAPVMGASEKTSISLSDFGFSGDGKTCICPNNQKSKSVNRGKKGNRSAAFDSSVCENCPFRGKCPVKKGKKHHYLRYNDKSVRIPKRRVEEKNEKFQDNYRWRAGVEATMSEYDSGTGVKKLRVRGCKNKQYCARLKAIGVNIFRAAAVRKARKR